MACLSIYKDISERTDGSLLCGVVGPVRTGKSSFIKRFMELLVIPNIEDIYSRERAKDELPQSASGRTIMTAEPKFVPEEAVGITLKDNTSFSVRLVDCVGYMVKGAAGQFEDGSERMVTTPWFDHEISMTQAAELGTSKVITEHSTIGLVVTTDGSICGIPREDYVDAEEKAVAELKSIGKPFTLVLNCAEPESESAKALCEELKEKYSVPCVCVNCLSMDENELELILKTVLGEFPISELALELPDWFDALGSGNELKSRLYSEVLELSGSVLKLSDTQSFLDGLNSLDILESAEMRASDMGKGSGVISIALPRRLYYEILSAESGLDIKNDGELMKLLNEISAVRSEYERYKPAIDAVNEVGYAVVYPDNAGLKLGEPRIVKQNGRYSVKLRANAEAIHLLKTAVETEISPALASENSSEEILGFLLQGYDGDMSKLMDSNLFGKPLSELAGDKVREKLNALPMNARVKLQETLQRIVNEGRGTLICILI